MSTNRLLEYVVDFLPTKFYIPEPSAVSVIRPQLNAQFDAAINGRQKLILVTAPAGFGKSTLVAQWLRTQDCRVAWLSLDAGDRNAQRFLGYLIHALNTVAPQIGEKLLPILQNADNPPTESILASLINDLIQYAQVIVLVLDDFHEVESAEINRAVAYLLDNQPSNLTLIITTRVFPDLSLSRMRVSGQLQEIHAEDLRFSDDEVRHLLNQNLQLALTAAQIRALRQRTEGWAAGLQLAALSLAQTPDKSSFVDGFSGSHRYITDYLTEEVLRHQPPEIQNFLLKTSVAERLSADLCNSLLGTKDSQTILRYLEANNLFVIPLDQERIWYRYHHLFADLLRQRFKLQDTEAYVNALQTVSHWHLSQGNQEEAVAFAFASGDRVFAAQMMTPLVAHLSSTGRSRQVREWLGKLPDEIIVQYASLCLYFAITSILQREFERVEPLLDAAEHAEHSVPPGYVDMARALYDSIINDGENALDTAYQALGKLPDTAGFEKSTVWLIISTHGLTSNDIHSAHDAGKTALNVRGESTDTRGLVSIYHNLATADMVLWGPTAAQTWVTALDQHRLHYEQQTGIPMTGTEYLLGMQALVAYEENDLRQAEQYCLEALDALQLTGEPYNPAIRDVYILLVRIALAKDDPEAAQQWHDQAQELIAKTYIGPFSQLLIERTQVMIWLAMKEFAGLRQWQAAHDYS
ncbi:MAG: AAA family ATPase, partial [Anaerolineae bacterium]|nr:AAA family ATPase [Anaerolineae bacterium]